MDQSPMRFASAISAARDADEAVSELLSTVEQRLTPGMADLVCYYTTAHFEDDFPGIVEKLGESFPGAVLLGCTAEGTIGCAREIERSPSMSILVGSMPDVQIRPFHITQPQLSGASTLFDWERLVGVSPESKPVFVALADPFRIDVSNFVDKLSELFPGAPLVGGLASAGQAPGQNRLLLNGEVLKEGIVGVSLSGNLDVQVVVSQGCRPIGKPFVITKGDRNVILELGGRPALKGLHDVIVDLTDEDEELAKQSLFVGRVIDEHKEHFKRGDFLIQNILGVDRKTGAVGIAGHARVGATVQFHVRDADSADEDLRSLLSEHAGSDVRGAMMFGCNGRGTRMWPEADHDVGVLHEQLGEVPTAGFFCGGEFGPVGGSNFIHGFTASIALLGPRRENVEYISGSSAFV